MTTVLVADNDAGVRSLLAELVRRQGYAVRTAEDGEAARSELAAGGVDVFVCDLDMPRLSGSQVLDWLGSQPHQPATVVVSGYLDARTTAELGRRPWVRASLRKPFDVLAFVLLLAGLVPPGAPASAADA